VRYGNEVRVASTILVSGLMKSREGGEGLLKAAAEGGKKKEAEGATYPGGMNTEENEL
jgi:hypothetical protein